MASASTAPINPKRSLALARRTLLIVMVLYTALVATHEGEFWPFSIYPMFSQAGKPWSRAVIYEVSEAELASFDWQSKERTALAGKPFAAKPNGVDVIDLAKFITMTKEWDAVRIASLRKMIGKNQNRRLVFFKVHGHLRADDSGQVEVQYEPVLAFGPGGVSLPPAH